MKKLLVSTSFVIAALVGVAPNVAFAQNQGQQATVPAGSFTANMTQTEVDAKVKQLVDAGVPVGAVVSAAVNAGVPGSAVQQQPLLVRL